MYRGNKDKIYVILRNRKPSHQMGCMGRNSWKNETFRVKINSKTRGMEVQVVLTLKTRLSIMMSLDI